MLSLLRTRTWGRPAVLVALGAAALAALTLLFNAAAVHAYAGNSDGATVVLEGVALRHGHLALGGWSLSLDSFWTVDALFYSVAVSVAGLRADLMHVVPALLGSLVVLIAIWLAARGAGPRGRIVGAFTVLVVLAIPSHALAFFFLQGPWHVGTALYCLVAFALLSRLAGPRRVLAAIVVLAAGLLGDLQTLPLGVIPIALGGGLAAARTRQLRAGLPQVVAAAGSVVLAAVVRAVTVALGTFRVAESHRTVTQHQAVANLGHLVNWGAALLGVHQGPFGGPVISHGLEAPRLLVAIAFLAALLIASGGVFDGVASPSAKASAAEDRWRLDDQLVCAALGSFGVFEYLTLSNNLAYARYLDPLIIYGVILLGRQCARFADRARPALLGAGVLVLALIAASSGTVLADDLGAKPPPAPTTGLEGFLEAHGLSEGIGDYWAASVVTVDTDDAVSVRPVVANLSGKLVSDGRNATSAWYHGQDFSFLVFDKVPFGRVTLKTAEHTFGTPAHIYRVGRYSVAVWSHSLRLGPETFP